MTHPADSLLFPARAPMSWSRATRVAFRFVFVYVVLYVLTTQMLQGMLLFPGLPVPDFGKIPPMRNLVMAVAHGILNVQPKLIPTGSGDTLFDWCQAFTLLLVAALVTIAWLWLDRNRHEYVRLHKWFRLFLRFALGTTMIGYGFAKLFPLQMPTVFLSRLLEPYGDFSPMGVIWYSIGASPGYERFIGFSEVLGGTLLFLPRTTLLGSLVSLGVTIGVFMINMTYDVPVKLFSFHLVLFCLVLLAPEARRLWILFMSDEAVPPADPLQFGSSAKAHRNWTWAQGIFGIWLLAFSTYGGMDGWKTYGGGAPRSPLYGIWDVDSMRIDGVEHPPLTTDTTRYRNLVFQSTTFATAQRMDMSFQFYGVTVDTTAHTITFKRGGRGAPPSAAGSTITYQRPVPERLILDGSLDGRQVHLDMKLHDLNKFLLVSRGFNWVQELPFNR